MTLILTRERNHGCSRPQDVHAGSVPVAEGRVEADVGQLSASDVLFLRGHVREDDCAAPDAHLLSCNHDVSLPDLNKTYIKLS
jgi:hypothetical protein